MAQPSLSEPQQAEFVHPVRRYAARQEAAEQEYHPAPPFADPETHQADDPARYDDALYGQLESDQAQAGHDGQHYDPAYADDPYAYQDGYGDEAEQGPRLRRGGMMTVLAVIALAVVGTGAAFAYRTYVGSPRSSEPPIIKADAGPNKVVPAPSGDTAGKPIQDRLASNNATEKMVSREEQPVDVKDNTKAGPRVVFPPLNSNANPPTAASVATVGAPPAPTAAVAPPGDEPRKIKTYTVRPDQADALAAPVVKPARPASAVALRTTPQAANASANAPLSLSPRASASVAPTRVASVSPVQSPPGAAGGYVVQISSQRSEADAQASFRALQGKFPSVLGSRAPLIKRADLGPKGVYYRAMVGPFGSSEDAGQFCGSLKTAGGQCVVQRN